MIVLHGIYDHGKIKITDKNLPQIKTKVEIVIPEETPKNSHREKNKILFDFRGKLDIDKEVIEKLRDESRV
jgi:hypothetical protein